MPLEPLVAGVDELVSFRPDASRGGDLGRVHEDLGSCALERPRHAHVIGMQMRDEDALHVPRADPGIGQSRAKRLLRLRRVHPGVDEAPAVRAFDEIRVDERETANRQRDGDAPDARRDEIAQRASGPREVTLGTMEAHGPFV